MKNIKKNILIIKTSGKILFTSLLLVFFITGCSKKKGCTNSLAANYDNSAEEDDGTCQLAGSGGATTIVAHLQHHGKPILNRANYRDTAYVKFNATELPGTSPWLFDLTFVGDDVGEDHVHLDGLKAGKYYIYMVGFDTTISQRVTGGMPYTLTQTAGEVNVNFAVTE
ncbi:MAG: hypothetical protein ABI855_20320 [Bacteroidota bacterium]